MNCNNHLASCPSKRQF